MGGTSEETHYLTKKFTIRIYILSLFSRPDCLEREQNKNAIYSRVMNVILNFLNQILRTRKIEVTYT